MIEMSHGEKCVVYVIGLMQSLQESGYMLDLQWRLTEECIAVYQDIVRQVDKGELEFSSEDILDTVAALQIPADEMLSAMETYDERNTSEEIH